jgi:hypothetical protein
MPPLTRLFVKTSFIYFVVALLAGVAFAARTLIPLPGFAAALTPIYFHLFMVGWVTEMIIGVGYWMFPKFTRQQPRGSDELTWATYLLLNCGLLLRIVAEPAQAMQPNLLWGWLLVCSALLQWLAALLFVANTWPRIKER